MVNESLIKLQLNYFKTKGPFLGPFVLKYVITTVGTAIFHYKSLILWIK